MDFHDFHKQKMKLNPYVTLLTNINSKWLKDSNVGAEIIKLLEEKIAKHLLDLSLVMILGVWPREHKQQEQMWTSGAMSKLSFRTAKQMINRMKRQPTESNEIFENYLCGKVLLSKIYKLIQLNSRSKQITQSKNGKRTWLDISPKKIFKWPTSKMLSITNHQGNANRNHSEIPLYTY